VCEVPSIIKAHPFLEPYSSLNLGSSPFSITSPKKNLLSVSLKQQIALGIGGPYCCGDQPPDGILRSILIPGAHGKSLRVGSGYRTMDVLGSASDIWIDCKGDFHHIITSVKR